VIKRICAVAVLVASTIVATIANAGAADAGVIEKRLLGYSVQHRPIVAYHLGNPGVRPVSLIIGQMHGDEHAGVRAARSIIGDASQLRGINVWVIPTINPDGDAHHTRQNAHHVDLNRNWPYHWRALTGQYYSGPHPLSEPETRAVRRFLLAIRPRFVVSLHQPLQGVDLDAGRGPAYHRFRDALSHDLGLPIKNFDCWSVCYGSLSSWFFASHLGVAVETVEFGWHPAPAYLTGQVRRGIVRALGGHFSA
jgi:murein peptide amidase A